MRSEDDPDFGVIGVAVIEDEVVEVMYVDEFGNVTPPHYVLRVRSLVICGNVDADDDFIVDIDPDKSID